MLKLINDVRKETDVENPRITELEKKIDEIEDALDEFAKLVRIAKASNCLRFSINNRLRSSHPEVFCKKDVLRSFAKLTGKHLCQSLFFNKVAGLDASKCFMKAEAPRPATLLKKKLRYRYFLVNFAKFLRTPFFIEHLWWLLLPFSNALFIIYFSARGGGIRNNLSNICNKKILSKDIENN